ncbi:MAG: hypothetical protein H0T74_12710, partial [Rubrobacteraceae bacterium]|nr:hypothetical protein [Rubrobacteraceae bacterium]
MTIHAPAGGSTGVAAPPDRVQAPEEGRRRVPEGPVKVVHAFWMAGMSC